MFDPNFNDPDWTLWETVNDASMQKQGSADFVKNYDTPDGNLVEIKNPLMFNKESKLAVKGILLHKA